MSPAPTLIVGIDPGDPTGTAVVARKEVDGSMTVVSVRQQDEFPIQIDPVWESLKAEFGDWDPIASSGWSDAALEFGRLWDEQWAFAEEWVERNPHRASEPRWTEPEHDEEKPISTANAKVTVEEILEATLEPSFDDESPQAFADLLRSKGLRPQIDMAVAELTPDQEAELREKFSEYVNSATIDTPRGHQWVKDRFLNSDQVHHPLEWTPEPEPPPSEEAEPPPAEAPKNRPTPRRQRKRKRRR